MRRLARRLAAFGILAALLVGCIQAEIAVRVEDDGSGTTSVLFAFDESLLELMESFDEGDTAEEFDPTLIFDTVDETGRPRRGSGAVSRWRLRGRTHHRTVR